MKMQGEVHTGKTITDLSDLVERAEARAGCYAASDSEASADDPVVENPIGEYPIGQETIVKDPIAEDPIANDPVVKDARAGDPIAEDAMVMVKDAMVEEFPQTAPLEFSTATRGLGSEFGAAADGAPFVAPSFAPYPGPSAAPKLLGRGMEALILAQCCVLLSRALAYVGLADLRCARAFAVEIRDHLDAINGYALAKGIGMELAEAQLNLMSVTGDFAASDQSA
jgi:hypothetical protein